MFIFRSQIMYGFKYSRFIYLSFFFSLVGEFQMVLLLFYLFTKRSIKDDGKQHDNYNIFYVEIKIKANNKYLQ